MLTCMVTVALSGALKKLWKGATLAKASVGPRKADAVQRVPIKHLIGAKRWKRGMVAQVQTEQGPRHVVVAKVGLKFADVDTNHPMAGKTLTFDIDIIEVRAASPEEIAHGHVHGPGGHH